MVTSVLLDVFGTLIDVEQDEYVSPYSHLLLPAEHGLEGMVDATVYSCDVGVQKPEPEIFAIALNRLGDKAGQTVMIGDDEVNDYAAARSLGMKARLVRPDADGANSSLTHVLQRLLSTTAART